MFETGPLVRRDEKVSQPDTRTCAPTYPLPLLFFFSPPRLPLAGGEPWRHVRGGACARGPLTLGRSDAFRCLSVCSRDIIPAASCGDGRRPKHRGDRLSPRALDFLEEKCALFWFYAFRQMSVRFLVKRKYICVLNSQHCHSHFLKLRSYFLFLAYKLKKKEKKNTNKLINYLPNFWCNSNSAPRLVSLD